MAVHRHRERAGHRLRAAGGVEFELGGIELGFKFVGLGLVELKLVRFGVVELGLIEFKFIGLRLFVELGRW